MPPRRAAWSVPTEKALRDLASFDAGDARVISLYLDVDGRRYPRRADYERAAADLLRSIDGAGLPRVGRPSLEADVRRIEEFITKEFERGAVRGLAVFACAAARLWDVYQLPVPIRSRAIVDRHPHVLRLEALLARSERFATVLVGRERARLFVTQLGDTAEVGDVRDIVPGKHGQGGWSQANYSRHIEALVNRHHRNAAEKLFALSQREPFDSVLLAGPEEVVATFEKALHPWLAERVVARMHLPATASRERVRQATLGVWDSIDAERSAEAVLRILEEYAAGRNAVVGVARTLDALQAGRVDVLAIAAGGIARHGWRCTGCRRLTLEEGKCPACGARVEQVADLAEEIVDDALARRCRVVPSQTKPLPDGVGALLRY
ncbi:MAG: Vms1/Ankzf1 family peptidyl-tRNA hydrolase [Actinomycetota bacterium]